MYSVRGNMGMMGNMPSQDQYGYVTQGNLDNSYGPWIDPELQRLPHRRSMINQNRKRKHFYQ